MKPTITLLGLRFTLEPHDMTENPQSRDQHIGYVQLEGSDTLKIANWHKDAWLDEKLRPFVDRPVRWHSLEQSNA